ncbi:MAG: DUF4296 domain-containing protein [Bacteroidales bacterium]|nr:DUF4296 domain-containing protein [Bacteroidales bacterium]
MRTLRHILLLGLVLLPLSCSRGRIIPARKFARLYADMLVADQWLRDHPEYRTQADTTLFYGAVFKKYGYSFKDYDASVYYYLEDPASYAKILKKSAAQLDRRRKAMEKQLAAEEEERLKRLVTIPEEGRWQQLDAYRDSLRYALEPADSTLSVSSDPSEKDTYSFEFD